MKNIQNQARRDFAEKEKQIFESGFYVLLRGFQGLKWKPLTSLIWNFMHAYRCRSNGSWPAVSVSPSHVRCLRVARSISAIGWREVPTHTKNPALTQHQWKKQPLLKASSCDLDRQPRKSIPALPCLHFTAVNIKDQIPKKYICGPCIKTDMLCQG